MGLIKLVIDTGILLTKVVPYLSMKQIFISVRFKTLNCFRRFICILGDPEYIIKLSEVCFIIFIFIKIIIYLLKLLKSVILKNL